MIENSLSVPHLTDEDYLYVLQELYPYSDYFTINLCSNSFFNIEYYAKPIRYKALIKKMIYARDLEIGLQVAHEAGTDVEITQKARNLVVPLLVKINEKFENLEEFINFCAENGIDGLVVGSDNSESSVNLLEKVAKINNKRLPIISYGSIDTGKEVLERLKKGASLVQIRTILLTKGPQMIKTITEELLSEMEAQGYDNIFSITSKPQS